MFCPQLLTFVKKWGGNFLFVLLRRFNLVLLHNRTITLMRLIFLTVFAPIFCLTLFQSCTADVLEIPKQEKYTRQFIKEFGIASPDHDWNMAQNTFVTVITDTPTNTKVYAVIDGKRYLFADYRGLSGKQDINLTIPKNVSKLSVWLNGRMIDTMPGATVDGRDNRSRIVYTHDEDRIKISTVNKRLFVPRSTIERYSEFLPENKNNLGKVTQDFLFTSNGPFYIYPAYYNTSHYHENTIGIYFPEDIDENGIVTKFYDFFLKTENGTTLTYTTDSKRNKPVSVNVTLDASTANGNCVPENNRTSYTDYNADDWAYLIAKIEGNEIKVDNYDFIKEIITKNGDEKTVNPVIGNDGNVTLTFDYIEYLPIGKVNSSVTNDATYFASQAIMIDIPAGKKFGMYITHPKEDAYSDVGNYKDRFYFFSQSELNCDYLWKTDENGKNTYYGKDSATPMKACHAATFKREDGMIRVCFEDWFNHPTKDAKNNNPGICSDFDLNDMVYYIAPIDPPNPPYVPSIEDLEENEFDWYIAAEDLGGSYDWDFNDLVVKINCVTTNYISKEGEDLSYKDFSKITVTPLAAGGTLPIYLMYTGKMSYDEASASSATTSTYVVNQEFHRWLGSYSMRPLNAAKGEKYTGKPVTFYVPGSKYTLAMHTPYEADGETRTNNMGGFWVLVDPANELRPSAPTADSPLVELTNIPAGRDITQITAPIPDDQSAYAPQMICVGSKWRWPLEEVDIREAYPSGNGRLGFMGWVKSPGATDYWYVKEAPVEENVFDAQTTTP